MSEENKALVRRMVEVVQSGHQLARMEAFFDANFVNHLETPDPTDTSTAVDRARAVFSQMFAAFPDLHVTIQDQVAEGDKVVTYKIFRGTHQGLFMGVQPTGQPVEFAVIDILRLKNGKITEHWALQDQLSLMQQLGL